jgi:hypothetical protein
MTAYRLSRRLAALIEVERPELASCIPTHAQSTRMNGPPEHMGGPPATLFCDEWDRGSVLIWLKGLETWGHELYRFPLMPQVRGQAWGTQCVGHPPGIRTKSGCQMPATSSVAREILAAPTVERTRSER